MTLLMHPRRLGLWAIAIHFAFIALAFAESSHDNNAPLTPQEFRRGVEQTFLTYPEWFLVHSPAEYAAFAKISLPHEFPFWGHIGQFWQGYWAVYNATKDNYPFNTGYHVMIMVIGTSTTGEYAMRSAYETIIGRLSALTQTYSMTPEDRFGAYVAQDYVDFIRVLPWYEYDFTDKLTRLWAETPGIGPDIIRKYERKYALTTEYAAKAIYGWLIKKATKASYGDELLFTATVVDHFTNDAGHDLPELKILEQFDSGLTLLAVPRYDAFKNYALALAERGVVFREIAGNRSIILVSALVPRHWEPASQNMAVLLYQPVLTQPARKRALIVVPVNALSSTLATIHQSDFELEHVYDY